MLKTISLVCCAGLLCAATAAAGDAAPANPGKSAPGSFAVHLDAATPPADVFPAILSAGVDREHSPERQRRT